MSDFYKILIIENSDYDLSKLDFAFINFSLVDIENETFKNHIEQISRENIDDFNFIYNLLREKKSIYPKYAIINNDIKSSIENFKINKNSSEDIYKFLLIINSSLQINHQILYDLSEDQNKLIGIQNLAVHCTEKEFLIDGQLDSINRFAKKYFNIKNNKLIKNISENYYNSFLTNQKNFQYLSLYTCLENLISGTFELSYRLQRTCAILSSDNVIEKEQIFKNVKKLREFRNDMVHGGSFKENNLSINLNYLRNLISVLIIRLTFIDNDFFLKTKFDTSEIDKWITSIGFSEELIIYKENLLDENFLNICRKKIIYIELK